MERFIKIPGFLFVLLLVFMLQSVSFGQTNVQLALTVTQQYVGNFYVGDLDFLQQNTGREIFTVNVLSVGQEETGHFDFTVNFVPLNGERKDLVKFKTNYFTIHPVEGAYDAISNSDMSNPVLVNYSDDRIVINDTDLNLDNVSEIEDYVQKTGKLPAGKYEFIARFIGQLGTSQDVADFMVVYNPTVIHLSSPGIRVLGDGSEIPGMADVSGTPLFQWHSDARLFNLFVYEKLPTDRSVNDVFGHEPFAEIQNIPRQNFQYPLEPTVISEGGNTDEGGNPLPDMMSNGAVRSIQEGKTYFWYVEAKIPTVTPGQYDILKSEVFQFNVAALDGVQNDNQRIIHALKNILIPGYKGQLDQFRGFNPSGAIYINGRKVSVEDLEKMGFEVLQKKYKIKKVEVN